MDLDSAAVPVPSTFLGFSMPVEDSAQTPAPAPIPIADVIRVEALASVQTISRELAIKATDPTTSTPHRLAINEQLIKLAGLDKKSVDATSGSGVSITINIPAVDAVPAKTIKIDSAVPDVDGVVDAEFTMPVTIPLEAQIDEMVSE